MRRSRRRHRAPGVQQALRRRRSRRGIPTLCRRPRSTTTTRSCGPTRSWPCSTAAQALRRPSTTRPTGAQRALSWDRQVAPAAGATCQHKARTGDRAGQRCGEQLCSRARHTHRCAVGGFFTERTEALERVCVIGCGTFCLRGCIVVFVQAWPSASLQVCLALWSRRRSHSVLLSWCSRCGFADVSLIGVVRAQESTSSSG